MMDGDGRLPVWENIHQACGIDLIWLLHADLDVDQHRLFGKAEQFGHIDRIVLKRILQTTPCSLGIVLAAQAGAHAEFSKNAVLGH